MFMLIGYVTIFEPLERITIKKNALASSSCSNEMQSSRRARIRDQRSACEANDYDVPL